MIEAEIANEVMDLRAELDKANFMINRLIDAGVDMERRVSKLEEHL
jgi:hypothetical protein